MMEMRSAMSFIALTASETALLLSAASVADLDAMLLVSCALSAFCWMVEAISSIEAEASSAEAARLATARRSAFSALARVAPTTILEDATVPRSELARMIRFVEQVARKHRLRVGTFGHMGDGNLHPTFLTDERNGAEMERVHQAFREIFDEAIRLGGTITGEHGIGVAKKEFLPKFAGDAQMRVMRELRRALDPNGILNPGKMFEPVSEAGGSRG